MATISAASRSNFRSRSRSRFWFDSIQVHLAPIRIAGITEIAYVHSNAQAEPYGLSTAAICAELQRPMAEQAMRFRHVLPDEDEGASLYAE